MIDLPSNLDLLDAHAHFFGHTFFKGLLSQRPGKPPAKDDEVAPAVQGIGLEPPAREPRGLADRWVAELDKNGVGRMVLMASLPSDWPAVAQAVKAHPDRFIGYAMVNPLAEGSLQGLEPALADGTIRGLCLFPAMHRFHIYDPPARRVVEAARAHRAVLFCHFGILQVPLREKLGVPSPFDGSCSNPTDLHPVASDFPDVSFQIPHFGAGYLRETLLLGAQRPNVLVDTSSSNGWMRLSTHPLDLARVVGLALEAFGPERILWGSDSSVLPRGWRRDIFELQLQTFRKAGCDEAALRAILGGNAQRVLSMK